MRRAALITRILAVTLALQLRQGAPEHRPDPLEGLASHQRAYCESPARRKVVTGGRRSGKTEAVVADLVATAIKGGECLYVSLTAKLAKRTIWKRLKARLRRLRQDFASNESTLVVELPNGGSVTLGGADDKEAIERYRGPSYALVVVDECGSQNPTVLKALVDDVLRPALMDHEGRLTLAGTPGPTLGGYWFEQAGPDELRKSKSPIWRWTIHGNPLFVGRVDAELQAVLDENEWTSEHPSYQREYLGIWAQDDGALVYPYRAERNGLERLPSRTERGRGLKAEEWRRVIAIDVGTTAKAMAIVVWAAHPGLPDDYLVHAEAHTGMLSGHLAERVRQLLELYPGAAVVMDAGGMGKAHALELAQRFALQIEPAEKREKASAIRLMRDRVLAGRVQLLNLPTLDGVRDEWSVLGWDDKHEPHHPSQADHYSAAALYGLRRLRNCRHDAASNRAKPAPGSEQALQEAMEREADDIERKRRRPGVEWAHRLRLLVGGLVWEDAPRLAQRLVDRLAPRVEAHRLALAA